MHNILTQRVYFVNNCETIEQVEEKEQEYIKVYGDKMPSGLAIVIRAKKKDITDTAELKAQNYLSQKLRSEILTKEISTEKYLNENK